jgi:HK97 family phage major capsid protein
MATNFPEKGDDKKISLRNSNFPQFGYRFAKSMKDNTPKIWRAGGNIRGNEAFEFWTKARNGQETEGVTKWIKEREAWASRHFRDGKQFKDDPSLQPNMSNVGGVVAQIKWGVIGTLGEQRMKDVILELTKKQEGKKNIDIKQVSATVKKALEKKVKDHNEEVKDSKVKWNARTTLSELTKVMERGIGAYKTNPSSVRPSVSSPEQWGYARVNSFLFALRTGRFQGGKHDQDLLPKDHPMKPKKDEEKKMVDIEKRHIIAVSEDEESVTIKYAKDHEEEDMTRMNEEEEKEINEEEDRQDDDKKEMTEEENKMSEEEEKMSEEEDKAEEYDDEEKEEEEEEKQDKASSHSLTYRHFSLKSEESEIVDEDNRTVRIAFSSEQPYERDFGIEILDHDRANLEFMASGNAPLLLDHDATKQIGIVENASIDSDKVGRATVRFGKSPLAEEVFNDVKDGIRRNISVGYEVFDMKAVEKGSEEEGSSKRTFRVAFKPLEASIVSIPADTSVGVGRSASITTNNRIEGKNNMSEEKTVNPNDILKAERRRVDEILALGSEHNCKDLANDHIKSETSVEEFKGVLLNQIKDKPLSSGNELGLSKREKQEYSLFKMINGQLSGRWDNATFERECSDEIAKRTGKAPQGMYVPTEIFARDLTQGSATAGGNITPDVHRGDLYIDALRSEATVLRAGAQVFTGLKGDIKIPRLTTKGTVGFVAENSAVSETNQAFDQVTMTQRDLGGFVDISRQLMNNANPSIEQIVRNDMTQQIALKIDDVAFEGGGSNEPTGITQTSGIGSVAIGTNGGAITYDATIDLIKEVATDNALKGSLGYAVTPEVVYQMRKTPKVASTDSMMIMDSADSLNGYPVFQSSQLPKNLTKGSLSSTAHAMIFGNFKDLLVGFYSGLDILVDQFTGASAGTVRLVFFQGVDIAVRHPESFSAILDIDETA